VIANVVVVALVELSWQPLGFQAHCHLQDGHRARYPLRLSAGKAEDVPQLQRDRNRETAVE